MLGSEQIQILTHIPYFILIIYFKVAASGSEPTYHMNRQDKKGSGLDGVIKFHGCK